MEDGCMAASVHFMGRSGEAVFFGRPSAAVHPLRAAPGAAWLLFFVTCVNVAAEERKTMNAMITIASGLACMVKGEWWRFVEKLVVKHRNNYWFISIKHRLNDVRFIWQVKASGICMHFWGTMLCLRSICNVDPLIDLFFSLNTKSTLRSINTRCRNQRRRLNAVEPPKRPRQTMRTHPTPRRLGPRNIESMYTFWQHK